MKRSLLVLLAACGSHAASPPSPGSGPAPSAPPRPMLADAAAPDASSDDSPPDAIPGVATPTADDRGFQEHVRAFARKTARHVDGWGTARLAATDHAYRFATLSPIDTDGRPAAPDTPTDGGYVLEEAPTRYWLVTFAWNAASYHRDDAPPSGEPPWVVTGDHGVLHSQLHDHGKTSIQFGFRDGALVLLGWEDANERRSPDVITHHFAKPEPAADLEGDEPSAPPRESELPVVDVTYGACRPRCPTLATYKAWRGAELHVSGPAASIDALVEPSPIP